MLYTDNIIFCNKMFHLLAVTQATMAANNASATTSLDMLETWYCKRNEKTIEKCLMPDAMNIPFVV